MPEITSETPRTTITIAGESFSVPQPYAEGHVLNANEASALNQTYAENVRNNQASKVKEHKEAGTFDAEVFQGSIDDYCDGYEFGVRTGGGRSGDPVRQEAMNIMRDQVRQAIVKQGKKLADYSAKQISELAAKNLDSGSDAAAKVLGIAKERVAASAGVSIDIVVDEAPEAPAPKKGKAKAEAAA